MDLLDAAEKKYLEKLEKQFSSVKPSKIKEIIGCIFIFVACFASHYFPENFRLLPKDWDIFYMLLFLLFPLSVYQIFKSYDNQWKAWSIIKKLKIEIELNERLKNVKEK